MQVILQCFLGTDTGPCGGVCLWSVCPHRAHDLHKRIQSIISANASLYWENTIGTRCGTSTTIPFDRWNSKQKKNNAFVIFRPQIGLVLRLQNCLQIGSRDPQTPKLASNGYKIDKWITTYPLQNWLWLRSPHDLPLSSNFLRFGSQNGVKMYKDLPNNETLQ